ncbi:polyketide cyclase/dehydrase/lipid transport protein [Antricoccus suffuscus]|uniref:Polyketide cyclase/dehydrase/lipid transport protein n=1 Tax=Antricoccus suffuscus TaxID=1629062 RepID=A0A2T0ZWQ7_9ACTN|nr:SRPBCC family protein [Antricoccus suffuscus]PRZ40795.1 polyketide cyclase/dehydrase/lipid transport protein [Antricoccus suffuscus]
MRYVDTPTVEVDIVIDASPERVYDIVSDINLPAQFSTEFQGATWLDGASGPTRGARFEGRNAHKAIGEWTTTCIVTAADSGREFSYAVSDVDSPSARWWFFIEQADGGTKLRHKMQIGPGESGLSPAIKAMPDKEERIIERRLQEHETNMRLTLEGVKALAERPAGDGS